MLVILYFINICVQCSSNIKCIALQMYVPLLKIEQTYYALRNKAQAAPTVQQYIDELTEILSNHLHHLVSYVTIRKGKVNNATLV